MTSSNSPTRRFAYADQSDKPVRGVYNFPAALLALSLLQCLDVLRPAAECVITGSHGPGLRSGIKRPLRKGYARLATDVDVVAKLGLPLMPSQRR